MAEAARAMKSTFGAAGLLEELIGKLNAMPPEKRAETERMALEATAHMRWVPNPGPQTDALYSEADELFLGGSAGGGKSSFLIGVATEHHADALIFRREFTQIEGLETEALKILGSNEGYNSQKHSWRIPGTRRYLRFGSMPHEKDKEKWQGRARDFFGFDEITHFTESQYRYVTAWLRSADPKQRCRIVATGNPPTTVEGMWVIKHWAAWLDPAHPNPAKPGELRWYTTIGGQEKEFTTGDPVEVNGKMVKPRSRTFIPASLEDNIDYMRTDYASVLEALPEDMRDKLRDGNFTKGIGDQEYQVIPTEWINLAQARWKPEAPGPMTSLGVDAVRGGKDKMTLAPFHGRWVGHIKAVPGEQIKDGPSGAAQVFMIVRDGAEVVIDMGGGYGGAVYDFLKSNDYDATGVNPAEGTNAVTDDQSKIRFKNRRAELMWRLREALDPNGPSPLALPPDPELKADLAAARYKLTPQGYQIEAKDDIKKRIGRSPDKGDSVALGLFSAGFNRANPLKDHLRPKRATQTVGGGSRFYRGGTERAAARNRTPFG